MSVPGVAIVRGVFGRRPLTLEMARTHDEQTRGLAGRNALLPDHGMLFWSPWDHDTAFTVEQMRFPIDIVFLDKDFRVIYVFERAQPGDPRPFKPPSLYRYALEVPAGYFASNKAGRLIVPGFVPS